jgi:hypothetical protein
MKTDALSRRLRFAPPNPHARPKGAAKNLTLTEADLLIFQAIDRHGPLPAHYLFEYVRPIRRSYARFQNRLTEFYNGDAGGPYLTRPPRQFDGFEARYQHIVYDLAPRAKVALSERGLFRRYSPKRIDPFLHQLMGACVAASIELTASAKGLRYIPREEILTHEKCPIATRTGPKPLSIAAGSAKVFPDDLFGLEYPGEGFRFFAVEIDRNTESIERRDPAQNAFARKLAGYRDVLRRQTYRARWGLPNLHVLTVTTNATHALNILDCVRKQDDRLLSERFAVAVEPSFGANWRVPKSLVAHLLHEPWRTANGARDLTKP